MFISSALLISLALLPVAALTDFRVKRQVSQLKEHYDFIIAGGGTAGLTVADRLTEALPQKNVLVVEYGEIEYAPGIFDPPVIVWGEADEKLATGWSFTSLPNPEIKNKTAFLKVGQVVGGSSAINGMFFDRGSRFDFEAWAQAGSPEYDSSENRWDWDGVFPYFKKSVTFTPPPADVVQKYGFTWDESVYGGNTPIYSSFPSYLWEDCFIVRDAWKEMGIYARQECAGGDKDALCWVPISEHPVTARRSHSGLGHYAAVNTSRANYDLLVRHQVTRILYPYGPEHGPPVVEVRSLQDDDSFNITTDAEVILSAGTLHTPTILQRSGIGAASVLQTAGIPVILDLPGVGSNLQDHAGSKVEWNYTTPLAVSPLPVDMYDPEFAADATAGFDEIPARGPYTLGVWTTAMFLPLSNVTDDYIKIVQKIRNVAQNGTALSYLPPDYRSDATMGAGYQHQLSVQADFLANPRSPSIETGFATGTYAYATNLHILSRGTVRLNLTDPLEQPVLDYRVGTNPIDFDVYLAHLKYLRKMFDMPAMQQRGAVETAPGPDITSDEQLLDYVKDSMTSSFYHPCCTAAMMPRNKGGVVGPDLKVHGAVGLRVVDMSVLPLLPSSHLSALAYAIGEKAAHMIISQWSE